MSHPITQLRLLLLLGPNLSDASFGTIRAVKPFDSKVLHRLLDVFKYTCLQHISRDDHTRASFATLQTRQPSAR